MTLFEMLVAGLWLVGLLFFGIGAWRDYRRIVRRENWYE